MKAHPAVDDLHWRLSTLETQILKNHEAFERALRFAETMDVPAASDSRDYYLFKRELADVEEKVGNYEAAEKQWIEAEQIAAKRGFRIASDQIGRAGVLRKMKRFAEAQKLLTQAKQHISRTGDHQLEGYWWMFQGLLLTDMTKFEAALDAQKKALASFTSAHNQQNIAKTKINLAWPYYELGQKDRALELYREAHKLSDTEDEHLTVGRMGEVMFANGEFQKAILEYRRAADLAKKYQPDYYAVWLVKLAAAELKLGKLDQAEKWNRQALTHPGKLAYWAARVNAGQIAAAQGKVDEAIETLSQVSISTEAEPGALIDSCRELARLHARVGQLDQAREDYELALRFADGQRAFIGQDENKLSYLESYIDLNQSYVGFLSSGGDSHEAFRAAEKSRAYLLRERLGGHSETFRVPLVRSYKRAAAALDATYLAYWTAPGKSYLWIIRGDSFEERDLPGSSELGRLVERYQRGIIHEGPIDPQAGRRLFDILLAPAIAGGSRFIIAPDGPLYGLNFETLLTPANRYWIEDATVAVAPSLEFFIPPPRKSEPSASVLLVGDAKEWNSEFPKLAHASEEIDRIKNQFAPENRTVLSGIDANPVRYQNANPARYKYIHFATHATANRNAPFESAIILSQVGGDGSLTVREILNSPVNADLVTISACLSAGAKTYLGEGLVGLAWAFLRSGAHGVVAGLWEVSDYASPRTMAELYSGLMRGERPETALREAKLKLLREPGGKFTDPSYWGAFQLYLGSR